MTKRKIIKINEEKCTGCGLLGLAKKAAEKTLRKIPIKSIVVGIKVDILKEELI